jgi:DNA-binding response OmpR family regulator
MNQGVLVGSESFRSAIVMEPHLSDALLVVSALTAAGFHITVAEGFSEAKALLSTRHPSLLVSEIRLGEFNGLQLILHGRAGRADMAAVLTAHRRDNVLKAEAEQMGGTFVLMPTSESELLAAILRTVHRPASDTSPIAEPFERRTGDRRTHHDPPAVAVDRRSVERRAQTTVHAAPSWILSRRPRRARSMDA